jgi:hypothetical protein
MEVPGLGVLGPDREIAVQIPDVGLFKESDLEDRALQAWAKGDLIPVSLEDLFQKGQQILLGRLDIEVFGPGAVQIFCRAGSRGVGSGRHHAPPALCRLPELGLPPDRTA